MTTLTPSTAQAPVLRGLASDGLALGLAVPLGLVAGAWTLHGQALLSDFLSPAANSAGTWCVLAGLVALLARHAGVAAAAATATLGSLVVGYAGVATLSEGLGASRLLVFWGAAALVVGPVLGLAVHAAKGRDLTRAAVGLGVLGGLLAGEAVSSLLRIADTTPVLWWSSELVLAVALAVVGALRLDWRDRGVAAAVMVATAVTVHLAYSTGSVVLSYV